MFNSNKVLFLFLIIALFHIPLYAQPKTWSRAYSIIQGINPEDGPRDLIDIPAGIVSTNDGGYVVASRANSNSFGDIWLMKLNKNGSILWQKGFDSGRPDGVTALEKTRDGGYVLTGVSLRAGIRDAWIMKLYANGSIQWQKFLGGDGYDDLGRIKQTPDGGFIAAGSTTSTPSQNYDIWLVKFNSTGEIEWQKTYDSGSSDNVSNLALASDGYVLTGANFSVIKLNSFGEIIWVKSYGGPKFDFASAIVQAGQDNFVVTGSTTSFGHGSRSLWVIKIDSEGKIVWQKVLGQRSAQDSSSIARTRDNGYLIAGRTDASGAGKFDVWLLKLDNSGNVQWQRTYGGTSYDSSVLVRPASDDGYVISATTKSFHSNKFDVWILKVDRNGLIAGCSNVVKSSTVPPENTSAVATNRTRFESSNTTVALDAQLSEMTLVGSSRNTCNVQR
jgi:hypothetical protein